MYKKILSIAITAVMLISLLLSGCVSKQTEQTTQKSATETKKVEQATPAPTSETKPSNLLFMGFKSGNEAGSLPKTLEDFMKKNPNIKVEYEFIGAASGYYDALKARLAANEKVDVFMSVPAWTQLYVDAGYAMDLNSQSFAGKLLDSLKAHVSVNGKLYGFPTLTNGLGLFVNKKILNDNSLKTPTNWTEFMQACKKLKEANILPMTMGNKDGWSGNIFVDGAMLCANKDNKTLGADLFASKVKFADVYLPAMKKLQLLIDSGYVNAEESLGLQWNQQTFTDFINGKAAFMIGGTWQVAQASAANKNLDFEFVPVPTNESGAPTAYILAGIALYVNSKTNEPDASLKFLNYFADKDVLGEWTKSQASFTTIKGGISTEEPRLRIFADTVAAGNTASSLVELTPIGMPEIIVKEVQLMMAKKETAEKAVLEFDKFAATKKELLKK